MRLSRIAKPAGPVAGLVRSTALALVLALTATPHIARAQGAQIEAAYVVLGGAGAVARVVLKGTDQCPAIAIDGAQQPMSVRAPADTGNDAAFPVLTCEFLIPSGAGSASVLGRDLPLPKSAFNAIAAFGDTGCRLNQWENAYQDCDKTAKWPFSKVAAAVAKEKPDLVIHVGDYYYRESACPTAMPGCKGSPYGDSWDTWKADFFAPAAPLLTQAPWIMTRGNHEDCSRGGVAYFRFLAPDVAPNQSPRACVDLMPYYTVAAGGRSFIVMDSANAKDGCKTSCNDADFAAQFAAMKPAPGTWWISHRPVWGIGRNFTVNEALQRALAATNGKLPDGIVLALSGHMHTWEALSFADNRSPQLIVGNGGTALDETIKRKLIGFSIGGTTVSDAKIEHSWGYTIFTPAKGGAWTATFRDITGKQKFACTLTPTDMDCDD